MSDKPIENVDIVAAILTASVIEKIKPEITSSGAVRIDLLNTKTMEIFKDIKDKLEK